MKPPNNYYLSFPAVNPRIITSYFYIFTGVSLLSIALLSPQFLFSSYQGFIALYCLSVITTIFTKSNLNDLIFKLKLRDSPVLPENCAPNITNTNSSCFTRRGQTLANNNPPTLFEKISSYSQGFIKQYYDQLKIWIPSRYSTSKDNIEIKFGFEPLGIQSSFYRSHVNLDIAFIYKLNIGINYHFLGIILSSILVITSSLFWIGPLSYLLSKPNLTHYLHIRVNDPLYQPDLSGYRSLIYLPQLLISRALLPRLFCILPSNALLASAIISMDIASYLSPDKYFPKNASGNAAIARQTLTLSQPT
jgi:hypothetical protein